jgi:hypothetical protein
MLMFVERVLNSRPAERTCCSTMATMVKCVILLAVALCFPSAYAQCTNDIKGYVTKSDTNWVRSSKTQESQTAPANAQQICSLDSNCIAWNSFGYYILAQSPTAPTVAATGISFTSYSGLCTYVKATALPSCPEKDGYVAKTDTNWVGSAQTQESQTAPANAQQICSLDQNCVAWNNFGYYILVKSPTSPTVAASGVSFTPYAKMCTYVKASALQAQPSTTKPAAAGGTLTTTNRLALRNMGSNLCLAANDAQRLVLGINRLALQPCSARDSTQGFKLVPAGNAFTIVDNKGRCVTTYSGVFVRTVAVMRCAGGVDQRWSIAPSSPDGRGPFFLKSQESGQCIINMRNSLGLGACDRSSANAAFQLGV